MMNSNNFFKTMCVLIASTFMALNASANPLTENDLKEIAADFELIKQFKEQKTVDKHAQNLYKKFIGFDIVLTQYRTLNSADDEKDQVILKVHHQVKTALNMINEDYHVPEYSSFFNSASGSGGNGVIRGVVTDENTQLPLEGVIVRFLTEAGAFVANTYTDSTGRYIMQNMTPGRYIVYAQKSGYAQEFYNGVLCPRGLGLGCQVNDLEVIELQASEIINDIDFSLVNGPTITGRIIDQDTGLPINAEIRLYTDDETIETNTYSSYFDGSFELIASGSGNYYVQINGYEHANELYDNVRCGRVCDFDLVAPIALVSNTVTDLGDIDLKRLASISGSLLNQQGNLPITGRSPRIWLYDDNGVYVDSVYNWQFNEGNWELSNIQPGQYYTVAVAQNFYAELYANQDCSSESVDSCETFTPDLITHDGESPTNDINMTLIEIPPAPAFINGQVRQPNGNPVNGNSNVKLYRIDNNGRPSSVFYSTNVDQNGNYSFTNVTPGSYFFVATSGEYHNATYPGVPGCDTSSTYYCVDELFGTPLVINESTQTVNHDFNLYQYPSLSGVVKDNTNTPIEYATVTLKNTAIGSTYMIRTDDNGQFSFQDLQHDEYVLYASATDTAVVAYDNVVCSTYNCNNQTGIQTIDVQVGNDLTGYDFSLPELPLLNVQFNTAVESVRGHLRVYDSNGNGVNNLYVNDVNEAFRLNPGSYHFVYEENQYYSNKNINQIYGGPNCYDTCNPLLGQWVNLELNQSQDIVFNLDQHFKIQYQNTHAQNYFDIQFYDDTDQLLLSRSSNSSGSGEIYFDSLDDFKLAITKTGYFSYVHDNIQCYGEACGLDQASIISPQINQSITIDFDLPSLASISGVLMDENQQPIAGRVELYNSSGNRISTDYTDTDGVFSWSGLSLGTFYLKGLADGYQSTVFDGIVCIENCDVTTGTAIEVVLSSNITDIEIKLAQYGTVEILGAKYVNGNVANNIRVKFVEIDDLNQYHPRTNIYSGDADPVVLPPGMYQIITDDSDVIKTAYPDIDCSQLTQQACFNQSTILTINNYDQVTLTDFVIHKKGMIEGVVSDDATNEPVKSHRINLYSDGFQLIDQVWSTNQGEFVFPNLDSGSYYLELVQGSTHMGELYEDVDCYEGIGVSCLFADGVAVDVSANNLVSVNFSPTKKPRLRVQAINSYNLNGVESDVRIYSSLFDNYVAYSDNEVIHDIFLSPGEYWVITEAYNYNIKGYPNAICESFDISQCAPGVMPVTVEMGQSESIKIELDLLYGINGYVTDGLTGEPLSNVIIDVWRNGYNYAETITSSNGGYSIPLYRDYDYHLSTDISSSLPYYNEVFENIRCVDGPAILNLCDPTTGSALTFGYLNQQPVVANFKLDGDDIFAAGFE